MLPFWRYVLPIWRYVLPFGVMICLLALCFAYFGVMFCLLAL